jgi:ribulose-5-phosphate 4-epimerase/fuculose-1-phosphate aldolase
MSREIDEVKYEVAVANRVLAELGLATGLRPMNQEGVDLVKDPLPMWDHIKTVQTDEEGMEVAGLLGNSKAMLLRGHGATTVGSTPEESVMNMIHLEEQAKMNYWAFSAAGPNHPYIEDELIAEMKGRTPLPELPHFSTVLPKGWRPRVGGVWQYYSRVVTDNPEARPHIERP